MPNVNTQARQILEANALRQALDNNYGISGLLKTVSGPGASIDLRSGRTTYFNPSIPGVRGVNEVMLQRDVDRMKSLILRGNPKAIQAMTTTSPSDNPYVTELKKRVMADPRVQQAVSTNVVAQTGRPTAAQRAKETLNRLYGGGKIGPSAPEKRPLSPMTMPGLVYGLGALAPRTTETATPDTVAPIPPRKPTIPAGGVSAMGRAAQLADAYEKGFPEGKSRKETPKEARDADFWNALATAGFTMAASPSPFPLQAAAQGALAGLGHYAAQKEKAREARLAERRVGATETMARAQAANAAAAVAKAGAPTTKQRDVEGLFLKNKALGMDDSTALVDAINRVFPEDDVMKRAVVSEWAKMEAIGGGQVPLSDLFEKLEAARGARSIPAHNLTSTQAGNKRFVYRRQE